ncbi:MAG: hypothetical protein CTY36_01795 [Methylocystis sp.]|nr:MAG: hypothetical protein CTY36_01795 [Methylocystis sp.]
MIAHDASFFEITHHLAKRGVLAADSRHIVAPQLFEPDDGRGVLGHSAFWRVPTAMTNMQEFFFALGGITKV